MCHTSTDEDPSNILTRVSKPHPFLHLDFADPHTKYSNHTGLFLPTNSPSSSPTSVGTSATFLQLPHSPQEGCHLLKETFSDLNTSLLPHHSQLPTPVLFSSQLLSQPEICSCLSGYWLSSLLRRTPRKDRDSITVLDRAMPETEPALNKQVKQMRRERRAFQI